MVLQKWHPAALFDDEMAFGHLSYGLVRHSDNDCIGLAISVDNRDNKSLEMLNLDFLRLFYKQMKPSMICIDGSRSIPVLI